MADLQDINKLLREQVELRSRLARLNGEIVSAGEQEVAVLQKQQILAKEIQAAALQQYQRDVATNKLTNESLKQLEKYFEYQKKSLDDELRRGEITNQNYAKQLALYQEIKDAQEAGDQARLDALREQAQEIDDLNEKLKESAKLGSQFADSIGSLVGFGPQAQKLGQSIMGMAGGLQRSGTAFKTFGQQLGQVFGPAGFLGFIIQNTIAVTLQSAKLQAEFVSLTGTTEDFQQRMSELGAATGEAFTRFSLLEQIAPLRNLMTSFADATDVTQDKFILLSNALSRLGIGANQSAELFNQLQTEFGFVGELAGQATVDLFGLAEDISQPPSEVLSALQDATPVLAQFGQQGVRQFANLAKSAKSMGFAVREGTQFLMQMAEGFDTFDSAASKVAEFNAFLGGPFLNTFDMVMASGKGVDEVLAELKDGFDSAGFGADDMSKNLFKARGIANALGVDVNKLEKFLKGTITQEELMKTETQELLDTVEKTVAPLEAISNSLIAATAKFEEIEKSITGVIDMVAKFIQKFTQAESVVGGFMYVIGGMIAPLTKVSAALAATGSVIMGVGFALLAIPAIHSSLVEFFNMSESGAYALAFALGAVTAAVIALKAVASAGLTLKFDAATITAAAGIATAGGLIGVAALGDGRSAEEGGASAMPDTSTASGALQAAQMKFDQGTQMQDGFVTKQPNGRMKVTPISSMDSVIALKSGGPIANANSSNVESMEKLMKAFDNLAERFMMVANRPVEVKSEVKLDNKVVAEGVNTYNNNKFDRKYY